MKCRTMGCATDCTGLPAFGPRAEENPAVVLQPSSAAVPYWCRELLFSRQAAAAVGRAAVAIESGEKIEHGTDRDHHAGNPLAVRCVRQPRGDRRNGVDYGSKLL